MFGWGDAQMAINRFLKREYDEIYRKYWGDKYPPSIRWTGEKEMSELKQTIPISEVTDVNALQDGIRFLYTILDDIAVISNTVKDDAECRRQVQSRVFERLEKFTTNKALVAPDSYTIFLMGQK